MTENDAGTADAFKLSIGGGEITIEFGKIIDPGAMPGGAAVTVSDRVIMPIDTGRRLLLWLDDVLRAQATNLQAQEAKALSPGQAAAATRPHALGARAAPAEAGEKAALLLRLVGALNVPYHYERSFRLAERSLQSNRFLLTVNARDFAGDFNDKALEICRQLGMPQTAQTAAAANFAMANCVHFGFEGDEERVIAKLYLERAVTAEEADRARQAGEPALLHLAYKWDLLSDSCVTTRYLWHPFLTAREIEERMAHIYQGTQQASFDMAKQSLALAAAKAPPEKLQYLEVVEEENARRSFDLNLYNARLQVKDIQPLLQQMREHFAVRPGQFQALYDQISTKALGHIAGGVHRNNEDFFNLYYGVIGFPQFNEKLAS